MSGILYRCQPFGARDRLKPIWTKHAISSYRCERMERVFCGPKSPKRMLRNKLRKNRRRHYKPLLCPESAPGLRKFLSNRYWR